LRDLKSDRSDVKEAYLFGSFASGTPTPKSDVDLLIVTEEHIPAAELLLHFLPVSVPVDIHVMTKASFREKEKTGKGIVGEALRSGVRLL
jgi:predicted nucleotidyltransferase